MVGILLKLLPSLSSLTINSYGMGEYPFYQMFGSDFYYGERDVSSVAGLAKLESLFLTGGLFDPLWFTLPKLRQLSIALDVREAKLPEVPSPIQSLIIHCEAISILLPPDFPGHWALGFAQRLNGLRDLTFDMTDILTWVGVQNGSWAYLIDRLTFSAPTLEYLRIMDGKAYSDLPAWFDTATPFHSMTNFTQLKGLYVPQGALLANGHATGRSENQNLAAQLLPRSIQNLTIRHPTLKIFSWLEEMCTVNYLYPHLQHIEFVCSDLRGEKLEDFSPALSASPVHEKLCDIDVGVSVQDIWLNPPETESSKYSSQAFGNFD